MVGTMGDKLSEDISLIAHWLVSVLREKAPQWTKAQDPSSFFDVEQDLQSILNVLQAYIMLAILEEIHRDINFISACKKRALLELGMQNSGPREVSIRTLNGHQIKIKSPYVVVSKGRVRSPRIQQKQRAGMGLYPVLRQLGIVRNATPRFLADVAQEMADGPSGADAEARLARRGIVYGQTPLWYQVRDLACIALWQRQFDASHVEYIEPSTPIPLAGKRVVVGIDGGRLQVRVNKRIDDRTTTKSYSADSCEPKLFVIYTVDSKGNRDKNSEYTYDGTLQSHEALFSLLRLRLKQLGLAHADLLVIIGDGARWIWKGAGELYSSLKLEKLQIYEIVDFAHAVSKLTIPAKLGIAGDFQQQIWLRKMRRILKSGKVNEIIEELSLLNKKSEEEEIEKAIQYFRTHQQRMDYAFFQEKGLPIGSGVIESGVKRIVNYRLRGSSIYWSPEKAEQVLHLRCQLKGGHWNSFVKDVLTRWARDISISISDTQEVQDQLTKYFAERVVG